jgi:hypothetical protein
MYFTTVDLLRVGDKMNFIQLLINLQAGYSSTLILSCYEGSQRRHLTPVVLMFASLQNVYAEKTLDRHSRMTLDSRDAFNLPCKTDRLVFQTS